MQTVKAYTKADRGRLSKVIEYSTGAKIDIPINRDGSVKWLEDRLKQKSN